MPDLKPITPLGGSEPRIDTLGSVTVTEVTNVALASVAARLGQEEATRATLARVIEAEAPAPAHHGGGTLSAFWTGPDQWMIEAPIATHEGLAHQMAETFGATASVTEQTDAWCRFDLTGYELPSVMELLCAVDLRAWQGGEVQRTTIDHLGCFVLNRGTRALSVIGPRSSAGSLHHALVTACKAAA